MRFCNAGSHSTLTLAAAIMVSVSSCGGSGAAITPPTNPPTISSVAISCTPGSIQTGQNSQCSVAVQGTGNYSSTVSWAVSPSTIGSVSSTGVFLPVVAGVATVSSTSTEDPTKSASSTVNVVANVDVSMANQTFEGWGTSLAWFANSVGGWSNTRNQAALMEALFSPANGLGLTYLRYNIGGGNDPLCGTGSPHYACISPTYHATPGYEAPNGTYDWAQDANQRWVAATAQSMGANLFEASSYSPPYWMTISGTSEGGVGGTANLASGYFGSGAGTFAVYLTTVASEFSTNFGITFHHLEPLNESGQTWWPAGETKQEGCAFTLSGQQQTIQDVQKALLTKGLVTQVAAMDEYQEGLVNSTAQTAANEFYAYDSATVGAMTALNTHGYSSPLGSVALSTSALQQGKRLTVSEWGSNDTTGQDISNQILADISLTRPVAWTIWQPDWPGLVNIDYVNQAFTLNKAYYVFEQYTKFIRPGFQFIAIADPQSLAAFNQQTQTLVIVTQNWTTTARNLTYSLSNFSGTGATAAVYQTSPTASFASLGSVAITNGSFSYTAPPNSVTTFVIGNTTYAPQATTGNDNTTGTGNDEFNYVGAWNYNASQAGSYSSDSHWSEGTGSYYTFHFSGQQARVFASMAPDGGIAAFSVDNGGDTYFDTYAATRADNVFLFATSTLPQGIHTLKVRVTGLKNPASTGLAIFADRVDVVSMTSSVGQGIYTITNSKNGLDLEVNSVKLADGGLVDTYQDVPGANNEHWNLMAAGDGSYRIVNVNSGLDLEVNGASQSNWAVADQWEDSGPSALNERWNLVSVGNGSYRIVNVNSGLDLELNATNGLIDQSQDVSGSTNQHWMLLTPQ